MVPAGVGPAQVTWTVTPSAKGRCEVLQRETGLSRRASWRRLLRYIWCDWKGWAGIVAVTLLSSAFGVMQPWPMKVFVDQVLGAMPLPEPLARFAELAPGTGSPRGLLVWVVLAGLV